MKPESSWGRPLASLGLALAAFAVGCGDDGSDVFGGDDDGSGGASSSTGATGFPLGATVTGATGATSAQGPTSGTDTTTGPGTGPGSGGNGPCGAAPEEDEDDDGFTADQGDCDDCDPLVSPAASEVGGNGVDDDCDGDTDEVAACDAGLTLADTDALSAAHALGICDAVDAEGFGLVDVAWMHANGTNMVPGFQAGILEGFGDNVSPQEGDALLALSSGRARTADNAEGCGSESCQYGASTPPPGFPLAVPNCAVQQSISDDVALSVTLKAPPNATGFRYRFRFYTFEFPEYVCSSYNDQFVAIVDPPPAGALNGNVSFQAGYPISANVPLAACSSCEPWADGCEQEALFDPSIICPPVPNPCCPEGPDALVGTGFDVWASAGAAATSWLETTVPVDGGEEFTIRFAIWDTGDMALDSTVVLDDFAWIAAPGVTLQTVEAD